MPIALKGTSGRLVFNQFHQLHVVFVVVSVMTRGVAPMMSVVVGYSNASHHLITAC